MKMNLKALGVLAALAIAGCGTESAEGPLTPGAFGRVRFVNLITDPGRVPVNAILENVPFGVNLAYTGTTPSSLPAPSTAFYSPILSGTRSLVLQQTSNTSVTVATIPLTITASTDYTVYAMGGTGGAAVTNLITTDVNTAGPATDTRFRVTNASSTAGPVDVFVTANGADLTGLTPDASNIAVNASSGYFTKTAGTYQIRFVPAGTAAAARNAAVSITIAAAAYPANTGRTIVAANNAAGSGAARGFVLLDR
jgi:hypothetical protein